MVIVVDITFSVEETNQTVNRGRNKFAPIVRNKVYLHLENEFKLRDAKQERDLNRNTNLSDVVHVGFL